MADIRLQTREKRLTLLRAVYGEKSSESKRDFGILRSAAPIETTDTQFCKLVSCGFKSEGT